jgi:hypothetical protein
MKRTFYRMVFICIFLASLGAVGARADDSLAAVTAEQPNVDTDAFIYVYRPSAFFGFGANYNVLLNDKEIGEISNASYLKVKTKSGPVRVSVYPGGLGIMSTLFVDLKPRSHTYLEYRANTGLLANWFYLGSELVVQTEEVANKEMADLKSMTGQQALDVTNIKLVNPKTYSELRDKYSPTNAFALEDVDAVPGLTAQCKDRYKAWLLQTPPKAFAVGPQGECGFAWGNKPSQLSPSFDPLERALNGCFKVKNNTCKMYAIDGNVVWIK